MIIEQKRRIYLYNISYGIVQNIINFKKSTLDGSHAFYQKSTSSIEWKFLSGSSDRSSKRGTHSWNSWIESSPVTKLGCTLTYPSRNKSVWIERRVANDCQGEIVSQ